LAPNAKMAPKMMVLLKDFMVGLLALI